MGEMMIPCQLSTFSEFICSAFQFQGHSARKKSLKAWKIAYEVRKCLKFEDVALNGAYWMHTKSGVEISLKNEMPL